MLWIGWGTMETESIVFPLFFSFKSKTAKVQTQLAKRTNLFAVCRLHFQIQKQINRDVLGSPNKPTIPGHCGFALSNPQKELRIDCVPMKTLVII